MPEEITIEHIIEVVCDLRYRIQRLNSRTNPQKWLQARQIAMYLAKQHTKSPLIAIGSAIGGRNHATVLHSARRYRTILLFTIQELKLNVKTVVFYIKKVKSQHLFGNLCKIIHNFVTSKTVQPLSC